MSQNNRKSKIKNNKFRGRSANLSSQKMKLQKKIASPKSQKKRKANKVKRKNNILPIKNSQNRMKKTCYSQKKRSRKSLYRKKRRGQSRRKNKILMIGQV